jgi:hypothetical protein
LAGRREDPDCRGKLAGPSPRLGDGTPAWDCQDNLQQFLLSHLRKDSPYAEIAYFIFLMLHRTARTVDALRTARTFLAGDNDYGYSNLLATLSAIVSHERFDIEPALYQSIEETLAGDKEHDFRLRQKINRAQLENLDRQTNEHPTIP